MLRKFLWLSLLCAASASAQTYQPNWESLDRRPIPAWFTDAKFGIFIHWGVYSVPAYAPVIPGKLAYAEWYWHAITEGQKPGAEAVAAGSWEMHKKLYGADYPYANFAPQFRAELFEPSHWADVFERSGAKYVALTSKHHEGFALWPSKEASATWGKPWNSVEQGPHRDLVGDLTDAVRAKGLKMGIYYSLYEWYNPLYLSDKPRYVAEHMMPQFKDVVTRYKPVIIFSDGEWEMTSDKWRSPELLAWLYNELPAKDEVVVDDRWGSETRHKHGGYWTTEYTPGMAETTHAWEESRGMGFSYGYNRAERIEHYHTGRELVLMLVDIVSRGGNLLLDIGPKADGTIPPIMEERLLQIGDWLKVNGEAIYGTRPWRAYGEGPTKVIEGSFHDADTRPYTAEDFRFTAKGNTLYAIELKWPAKGDVVIHSIPSGTAGAQKVAYVELIGSDIKLAFQQLPDGLHIQVPEHAPGKYAFVYRLRFTENQ